MMSSRVLSRLLPVAEGDVSMFDGVRRNEQLDTDLESQQAPTLDELFHDDDDDPEALLYDASDPRDQMHSIALSSNPRDKAKREEDEDVPASLLLEERGKAVAQRSPSLQSAEPSASDARITAQWRATQEQQGLHSMHMPIRAKRAAARTKRIAANAPPIHPNPQAEAMWLYTNASNLDAFLLEIYQYYVEHGVWSILLKRAFNLLTELFLFSFTMFLTTCVDYSLIPTSKATSEILIPKCMAQASWLKNAALFIFIIYWGISLVRNLGDIRRLLRMRDFYHHVLGIDGQDLQTVSWVRVVNGLVKVQNANIATANAPPQVRRYIAYTKPQQRLSAESIANRLMRQANYYVALYNKDVLDFTLPLPFVGSRQFYSKSLEWCIDFCLTNFIFDEQGSIRPFCLDVKNRAALVRTLQMRLQFAALTSVLIAPFNILRFCVVFFLRYYTEFSRNPSKASARTFTPFAEWKIREFNELDHLFQQRLRQAYPCASEYLKQFPKDKTDQACRFIAFISGSIAAVLTIATLLDPELFLGFEVTPGRTAVFWLTIMVGIFGIAQGSLPDENDDHDPVPHLKAVLVYTHYMPAHWKDRLHSNEVRAEFSALYQMKVLIFIEEILSLIVAPWILLRNAGKRSERIVDFFREHTVHVDGIGYQCNFAVFGFKKDPNAEDPAAVLQEPDGLRDDYYGLKDDKMAASVQNFMQYYSHYNTRQGARKPQGWQPPPAWPPMLSPSAIAEEPEPPPTTKAAQSVRPTSVKRSGILDPRRHPAALASPKTLFPRDRRQHVVGSRNAGNALGSPPAPAHGVSESVIMRQDADLNDYIEGPSMDRLESDTDGDEGDDAAAPGGNAGVLGMLYQFSKAQTERGTGVSI